MLDFGNFKARDCGNGIGRRSFLKTASALPFAFGAGYGGIDLEAARKLGDRAKAKSVILLWLWGGPSHLDTFAPKPDAPMEYRGPFGVIPTKTDGLQVTDLLPQLAKRSHLYSVIRSMQTTNGGHPGAGTVGLTGFEENPTVHPNFGSIMSKHRGRSGALPPFFYLGQGIPRDLPRRIEGYGGGTLGKAYDPFLVSCSENGKVGIPTLDL